MSTASSWKAQTSDLQVDRLEAGKVDVYGADHSIPAALPLEFGQLGWKNKNGVMVKAVTRINFADHPGFAAVHDQWLLARQQLTELAKQKLGAVVVDSTR